MVEKVDTHQVHALKAFGIADIRHPLLINIALNLPEVLINIMSFSMQPSQSGLRVIGPSFSNKPVRRFRDKPGARKHNERYDVLHDDRDAE